MGEGIFRLVLVGCSDSDSEVSADHAPHFSRLHIPKDPFPQILNKTLEDSYALGETETERAYVTHISRES